MPGGLPRRIAKRQKKFASQAIELDPAMARPRVVYAMCNVWDVLFARSESPARSLVEAMARKAVELDHGDAEAHAVLGVVALFMRRFDDSLRRLETALEINPNLALAYMWAADTTRCPARAARRGRTLRRRCA